jgi:hypothetical protein
MVQDKEVEVPLDTVADVMGKYLLENMLCRNPSDRMALRDAVVYADQIGAEVSCLADWYIAQSARERVQFCTIRGPLGRELGAGTQQQIPECLLGCAKISFESPGQMFRTGLNRRY